MSTYRPSKRAHRVLQRLERGVDTFAGLLDLFAFDGRANIRPKLHLILTALRQDGFVDHGFGGYRITAEGRKALCQLDAGEEVRTEAPQTSVKYFGTAA